mgnify:CR=1 FL=1
MKAIWTACAAISGILFVGINVLGAKLQVKGSRIARWQSRQDLSDAKYFVQYTPEQIAQAKANLENKEENVDDNKKTFFKGKFSKENQEKNPGFIKTIVGIVKDNKEYKEWKNSYNLEDRKVSHELTQEEIEQAQKDKELIQRITKQINNKAEDYGENMEVASGILIGGTPYLGAAVGFTIKKLGDLFKINEKMQGNANKKFQAALQEYISKLDGNSADKAREILKNSILTTSKNGKNVKKINTRYLLEKSDDIGMLLEQVFKNAKQTSLVGFAFKNLSTILNGITSTSKGTAVVFTIMGSVVTGILGSIIGLKLQKSASRAGRFKAKQELLNDPQNFVGYTEKDYESTNNVKAPKISLMKRLGNYIMFVPRCIADYFEYEKFKKNEGEKNKELLNELIKLDVTDEQLKEAKDLQRKVFTTFETVDDKSQEYSESMETANEMMKPFLPYFGLFLTTAPIVGSAILAFRKGGANFVQKTTGFIAKHTGILKSKAVGKYFDNVGENLRAVVQKQSSTLTEDINKKEITRQMLEKLLEQYEENIPSVSKEQLKEFVNHFFGSHLNELGGKIVDELLDDCDTVNDLLRKILSKEYFDMLIPDNMDISKMVENAKVFMSQFATAGKKIAGGVNETTAGYIGSGAWRKFADDENIPARFRRIIKFLDNSKMTNAQALDIYNNLKVIIKNIPAEQLNKIINVAWEEFDKNPEKFIKAVKSGELKTIIATKDAVIAAGIATGTWSALSLLVTYALESAFADMQKKAGRLGVMQGLNELSDDRFYANNESFGGNQNIDKQTTTPAVVAKNMSPMLRKQLEKNG